MNDVDLSLLDQEINKVLKGDPKLSKIIDTELDIIEGHNIKKKDSFTINQSGKVDLKFESEKVKSGITLEKVSVVFINKFGEIFLCTGLLFDKERLHYVKFKADNKVYTRNADETSKIIYPNTQNEFGYFFHEYAISSFRLQLEEGKDIKIKLVQILTNMCTSYDILKKVDFSKRMADMGKSEITIMKYMALGAGGFGLVFGLIIGLML